MMSSPRLQLACAAILMLFCAGRSPAQMLLNGSFENPVLPGGSVSFASPDDWTANDDTILISNDNGILGNTPYGSQYEALANGSELIQTVGGFVAGQTYEISADYAVGEFVDDGLTNGLTITLSGAATASGSFYAPYQDEEVGLTIAFKLGGLIFTPDSNGSITFSLGTISNGGNIVSVDNVSLSVVPTSPSPEPGTWLLMMTGAGMLIGLRRCLAAQTRA